MKDFDDHTERLAFKERLKGCFSGEDLIEFDELIVVSYAEGCDSNTSTRKSWLVEWLAGPAGWALKRFDSNILPPGTRAEPWDQKHLLVHF